VGIKPARLGQLLYAIAIAVLGMQYLQYGKYQGGLPPVPPWAPGGAAGAYLVGVVLIATAVSLGINKKARLAALVIGGLFLFCALFLQLSHFSAVIHDGVARTRMLEPFALGGAAIALAGLLPAGSGAAATANRGLILLGRIIFGFSMMIFGWQHFMYAAFLATLVPAWLPAHLFWICFTGAGMIAAGLAITLNIVGRLASAVLALMFSLWVLILHGPRVLAHAHNGDEISSLFVALAFCGASVIIASALSISGAVPRPGTRPSTS
jgi:uncharacterized membrane protein